MARFQVQNQADVYNALNTPTSMAARHVMYEAQKAGGGGQWMVGRAVK